MICYNDLRAAWAVPKRSDITLTQLARLPNGSYGIPHTRQSSFTVYVDCCDTVQPASHVFPLTEQRAPSHCSICGTSRTPTVDVDRDAIYTIAAPRSIPYILAEFYYKSFLLSDYSTIDKWIGHLKVDGLTGPRSLIPPTWAKGARKTMTTATYQTISVHCKDCLTTFRLQRVVTTHPGEPRYCMICGSTAISTYMDAEQDHYEAIATAYDTTVENIKNIMEAFGSSHHSNFSEFVAAYNGAKSLGTLCDLYLKHGTGYSDFESWIAAMRSGK